MKTLLKELDTEDVYNYIKTLNIEAIREIRNFCDRTNRIKAKEARQKKIEQENQELFQTLNKEAK